MNQWYFGIGIFLGVSLLILGMIVCGILFVKQKFPQKSRKVVVISLGIHFVLLAGTILYAVSHSTYYKYNDWAILQSNIHQVEEKYGTFDLGEIQKDQKGRVAYYIYTDNGPIMPDYLKHYYYLEYDEKGIVYHVYEGCLPGG